MTRFPSASAYQVALQHPVDALVHPDLRGATIAETMLGAPRAYSGARAAVFPIDLPAGKFALKCFVGNQPGIARRYRAILAFNGSDGGVSVEPGKWLEDAVMVDGQSVPALLTPWIDGQSLNAFVAQNLGSPAKIARIAIRWFEMIDSLEAYGLAHADLQHGNVLVTEAEGEVDLRLIDFDGAFVPALRRLGPLDAGHRHYQHPDRSRGDYNAKIDRFSAIVIHVALKALATRPDLWARHDTSENMLFTARDFLEPGSSQLFAELQTIPEVAHLSEALRSCCLVRPSDVPPLSEIVADGFRPGARMLLGKTASSTQAGPIPGIAIAVALTLPIIAAALLGTLETAAAVLAVALIVGAAVSAAAFLSTPEERRFRRLNEQLRYARAVIASIESQRAEIGIERERYVERREALASDRLDRLRTMAIEQALRHHFVQEVTAEGYASHKVVIRLKRAGVRTAADIREDVLSKVTQVSEPNLAAVRKWRTDLEQKYSPLQPDSLSPAEQRRLERQIQHRLEGFDRDDRRLAEREAMQRRILSELEERRPGPISHRFRSFLRSLMLIRPRPKTTR
jgi:hypothetical protein